MVSWLSSNEYGRWHVDGRYFKLRRRRCYEPELGTLPPLLRAQSILKLPRHLPLQNGLGLLYQRVSTRQSSP
jgi:hypothetical protein